jgi:hypothetical protein
MKSYLSILDSIGDGQQTIPRYTDSLKGRPCLNPCYGQFPKNVHGLEVLFEALEQSTLNLFSSIAILALWLLYLTYAEKTFLTRLHSVQ